MIGIRKVIFLLFSIAFVLYSCNTIEVGKNKNLYSNIEIKEDIKVSENDENISISNLEIFKDEEFGGIFFNISIDDFDKKGFKFGDSVDIEFSNGYKVLDMPHYNGYYAKTGEVMLISYPTYGYLKACICNGDSLWKIANVKNEDTAKIKLRERGKYIDIQNVFNLKYSNDRKDYTSDEEFSNFRNIKLGSIKENILYRGASPINNIKNKAKCVDELIEKVGIKYIVDLADNKSDIEKFLNKSDFDSQYFKKLYDESKVALIKNNMNYKSKEFAEKIVKAMISMSKNEGPYYVYCEEGKDRTGFLCMIIEGLAGATYEEIVKDYMITYDNYYGVSEKVDKERYDIIANNYIVDMLRYIADRDNPMNKNIDLKDLEYKNIIGRYLTDNGMSFEELDNWYNNLLDSEIYSEEGF